MNVSQLIIKSTILISVLLLFIAMFWFGIDHSKSATSVDYGTTIYEVDHPFTTESTNLLKENATRDKLDTRLDKYDIEYALNEVFLSEGFALEADMAINQGKVNIPVTTFDSETNIGYLIIDYDRLGAGLSDDKLGKAKTLKDCQIDFLKLIDQGIELYFDDEEKFLEDVFGKTDGTKDEPPYHEKQRVFFEDYKKMLEIGVDTNDAIIAYTESMTTLGPRTSPRIYNSILINWNFYGKISRPKSELIETYGKEIRSQLKSFSTYADKSEYLEIILPELKKKLEVENISSKETKSLYDEWKLSAADMIEEPERFFGFTGMIDNIRIYNPTLELTKQLNEQIIEVIIETNSKEWWNRSKAIFDLFNVNQDPGLFSKMGYKNLLANILSEKDYTKWTERYIEIKNHGDKENISLDELNALSRLAIKNGIYIAPISILDDRMIYDMEEEKYLEELASVRDKISKSNSKKERQQFHKELLALTSYRANEYAEIRRNAKAKSLAKLQQDMCSYIDWARNQSMIKKGDNNT